MNGPDPERTDSERLAELMFDVLVEPASSLASPSSSAVFRVSHLAGSKDLVPYFPATHPAALANLPAGDVAFSINTHDGPREHLVEVCSVADLRDKMLTGRLFDTQLPNMLARTSHGSLVVFGAIEPTRQRGWTEGTLVAIGEDWRETSGGWGFYRALDRRGAVQWIVDVRRHLSKPMSRRRAASAMRTTFHPRERATTTELVFAALPDVGTTWARLLAARYPRPLDAVWEQDTLADFAPAGRRFGLTAARGIVTALGGAEILSI